jgi:hypothetical protein
LAGESEENRAGTPEALECKGVVLQTAAQATVEVLDRLDKHHPERADLRIRTIAETHTFSNVSYKKHQWMNGRPDVNQCWKENVIGVIPMWQLMSYVLAGAYLIGLDEPIDVSEADETFEKLMKSIKQADANQQIVYEFYCMLESAKPHQ